MQQRLVRGGSQLALSKGKEAMEAVKGETTKGKGAESAESGGEGGSDKASSEKSSGKDSASSDKK